MRYALTGRNASAVRHCVSACLGSNIKMEGNMDISNFVSFRISELVMSRLRGIEREEVREPTAGSSAEVDGPPSFLSPTSNHHQQQDEHSWPRTSHWFLAVYLSNSHFPWLYWIKLAVYFPLLVELMSACSGHSPPISLYLLNSRAFRVSMGEAWKMDYNFRYLFLIHDKWLFQFHKIKVVDICKCMINLYFKSNPFQLSLVT